MGIRMGGLTSADARLVLPKGRGCADAKINKETTRRKPPLRPCSFKHFPAGNRDKTPWTSLVWKEAQPMKKRVFG
jgi:hypothetical protein